MTPFTLRTLGTLGLERRGGWVRLDADALGLLCLLRLSPDGATTRAAAGALLFPEEPARRIDTAVATINRTTGVQLVAVSGDNVRVDRTLLDCDVAARAPGVPGTEDRFLSGFDLPQSPAFRAWAEARRADVQATPEIEPAQKRLPRAGSAALGALGIAGLVAVYATRSTVPVGFEPGDPIAVVAADGAPMAAAFVAAALQSLSESRHLIPFDGTGAPDRPEFTATLAGTAEGGMTSFRIVLTSAGDTLAVDSVSAASEPEAFAAMDRLLAGLRRHMGERASERYAARVALARLGTSSLEALVEWAAGRDALARGDRPAARAKWQAALDRDPAFAWAHLALADDAVGRGDPDAAGRHYRAALADPARLPARDRARAEAAVRATLPDG